MSSIDQAFVKAFARRNRPSQPAAAAANTSQATPTPTPPPASRAVPSTSRVLPANTPLQNDLLRVDPSVNSSVEIWNDPSEERVVRVDSLKSDPVPAPHAISKPQSADPQVRTQASLSPETSAPETSAPETSTPDKPIATKPIADRPIDNVRSIQESLDLLQHSFTTLEAPSEPAEDLANIYSADVLTTAPPNRLDPETRPETLPEAPTRPLPSDDTDREPEIVQRRIDVPVDYSAPPTSAPASEPTFAPASEPTFAPASEPAFSPASEPAFSPASEPAFAPASEPTFAPASEPAFAPASEPAQTDFGMARAPAESQQMRPVWEVDVFDVPTAVADLFFDGPLFQQVAERVLQAVNSGLTSMMVTSVHRGEGRSTVAIGMAMAAAAAGLRVALVDADIDEPTLMDDLRLDLEYGWVDTVRGGLAIGEVAVHAVEDGVTLIPLMPPCAGSAATDFEVVQLLQSLRGKFDLVVVDTPSLESSSTQPTATTIDSALIVRDGSRTDAEAVNQLSYRLREQGVQGVGVVDNFA